MLAGLIVMDLLWAAGLLGLAFLAALAALTTGAALWPPDPASTPLGAALSLTLALTAALLTYIVAAATVSLLLPKPRPGRHRMLSGASFYLWVFGFVARRWLEIPPMSMLWRQSHTLRFLVLRLCGARLHPTAQMASDAALLDPALVTLGRSTMLGTETTLSGHMIAGHFLVLGRITLADGVEVGLGVRIGPGVQVGPGSRLQATAQVGPFCRIGARCSIGAGAQLDQGVQVGDGATIAANTHVPAATIIPAGATWPPAPGPTNATG